MPAAQITLVNLEKAITRTAKSDSSGVDRFPSLAPGNYRVTAIAQGFNKAETTVVLSTNKTRDISLTLGAEGVTQGVTVTTEAPLLNTAETRNQLTLDKHCRRTHILHVPQQQRFSPVSVARSYPITRHFFFSIEPLRSVAANNASTVTFEDPAFVQFAKAAFPNTVGTSIVSNYGVAGSRIRLYRRRPAQLFPVGSAQACGTASTGFLPCGTPVLDQGQFSSSAFRNAVQYNVRLDKYFSKDRLYGTVYRQHLVQGPPTNDPLRPPTTLRRPRLTR